MVLQAYFDDSKQDGGVLILAGYLATAERWASFADEWNRLLSIRPPWKRFKASEVCASLDEHTLHRVQCHYRTIEEYVLADICVAVPLPAFEKVCDEFGLPRQDRNPYFFAWNMLMTVYLSSIPKVGVNQPVEFYFDDQSEKTKILLAWDNLYRIMPRKWKTRIRNMPAFKSDEDVLPLQAADFVAWWKRKEHREHGTILRTGPLVPWKTGDTPYAHLYGEVSEDGIRKHAIRALETKNLSLSASFSLKPVGGGSA